MSASSVAQSCISEHIISSFNVQFIFACHLHQSAALRSSALHTAAESTPAAAAAAAPMFSPSVFVPGCILDTFRV